MKNNKLLIIDENGKRLPFTCKNTIYSTDINKGYKHGKISTRGNFLRKAIATYEGNTLWLEHVIDRNGIDNLLWFIWYDKEGYPKTPGSTVFATKSFPKIINKVFSELLTRESS